MTIYNAQDEQLFQAVSNLKAGDANSYYTMYDMSIKYIYKLAYDIVRDYGATEYIVQETYTSIYNNIGYLQDSRSFYQWAGRIATSFTLRYIQANMGQQLKLEAYGEESDFVFDRASQDTEEFIPESIMTDMEKQRIITELIDGLKPEEKLVIQCFYYEDMSVGEIAQTLGCSETAVRDILKKVKRIVREAIADLDIDDKTKLYSLSTIPVFFILFKAAVDRFAFAGAAVAGATTAATGGAVSSGAAAGEGVASGAAGEGVASGAAGQGVVSGATGEGVASGAAGQGVASGTSAGGAVASGLGKGFLGKIGASLGAKIAAGIVATGIVVAGGVIIHDVVTEEEYETTAITTEDIADASSLDAGAATTEAPTTEEVTTEAVAEEVSVSDEELFALNTMVINLSDTVYGQELDGTTLNITQDTVWEFVGRMNNNAQFDGAENQFMPSSVDVNTYALDDMKTYAVNVFGIDNLEYTGNSWFTDKGDGTFTLYPAQWGDLDKSVIKNITVDGDVYTVTGTVGFGQYIDINQSEPSYVPEAVFDFTMEVVKSENSPFGFKVNSISYVTGNYEDMYNEEPDVVITVGAGGDSATEVADSETTEAPAGTIEMTASAIDPNTTDPTMMKYLEIIKGVCNEGVWPDGSVVAEYSFTDLSDNEYGVLDIDGDGRKELVVAITNTSNAEMSLRIYDYDADGDKLVLQETAYPYIDVYDNGAFLKLASHNHSYSLKVWPYTLHMYDSTTDSYTLVADVMGWEKEYLPDGFPDASDVDGDGLVYEIVSYKNGDISMVESTTYMDQAEYFQWRSQYVDDTRPVVEYVAEPMGNVLR